MNNPIVKRLITNRIISKNGELQLSAENLRNYPRGMRDKDSYAIKGYITTFLKA